jgi:hypothetical protein
VIQAALGFLDALARGDTSALAAAASGRFSFDGEAVDGREAQARRWREVFAARPPAGEPVRDLAVMPAEEAIARIGPPPPRLAPQVRPGAWVAVGDLAGRPVVLVLVRDAGRFAVAALHD